MRRLRWPLRILSLVPFILAWVLFNREVQRVEASRTTYPAGTVVAGLPIAGLTRAEAAARLQEAYASPVEMTYRDSLLHLFPGEAGCHLFVDEMLSGAAPEALPESSWDLFQLIRRGEAPQGKTIPLQMTCSTDLVRLFLLEQVAARYDQPSTAAVPYPGLPQFIPGAPGVRLDIDASLPAVEAALYSLDQRRAALAVHETPPLPASFANLEVLLRQIVELSGFDGQLGLYVLDLQNGDDLHLLYNRRAPVGTEPDGAFTASSTIKIPIMVSVFRRLGDQPGETTVRQLERMIGSSDNAATDWLVQNLMDPFSGPMQVTGDMQALGMENTFWAGYFYQGAPLLYLYTTPANQRADLYADRDLYNQTTPSEMGMLLGDIYHCAQQGGGSLLAVFPGEISQAECQRMIDYLIMDRIPLLIQQGVPDGTRVAHKHGWISSARTGVIHDVSDAGIVFTPGGDFVMAIYMHHPAQLLFDPNNQLVATLSRAVYNFYNQH